MRCSSCDCALTGSQIDAGLCGECRRIVHYTAYPPEDTEPEAQEPPSVTFDRFVRRFGMETSWLDGLGLMDAQKRAENMRQRAYGRYKRNLEDGVGPFKAFQLAIGRTRRGDTGVSEFIFE